VIVAKLKLTAHELCILGEDCGNASTMAQLTGMKTQVLCGYPHCCAFSILAAGNDSILQMIMHYEEHYLLGYNAVYSAQIRRTFLRNITPPFSGAYNEDGDNIFL
jgi:hypothetical protein